MPPSAFATALTSTFAILGIWCIYHFLLKGAEVARFRDLMFAVRDELFDLVVEGKLDANDPAYFVLRQRINGFIRFAHRLSIPSTVGLVLAVPSEEVETSIRADRWLKRMQELAHEQPEIAKRLNAISDKAAWTVATHVFLMSPVIGVLGSPLVVLGLVAWRWIRQARRLLEDLRRRLRFVAESAGGPSAECIA